MEEAGVRVLVVGDDPLARARLAMMLDQEGCTVAGQVAGNADLLLESDLYRPDVVLWDLGWDPAGGQVDRYLQSDAVMYPGFSGGPLIYVERRAIGLNTSALLRGVSLGDTLVALDGQPLRHMDDLVAHLGAERIDQGVSVRYLQGG